MPRDRPGAGLLDVTSQVTGVTSEAPGLVYADRVLALVSALALVGEVRVIETHGLSEESSRELSVAIQARMEARKRAGDEVRLRFVAGPTLVLVLAQSEHGASEIELPARSPDPLRIDELLDRLFPVTVPSAPISEAKPAPPRDKSLEWILAGVAVASASTGALVVVLGSSELREPGIRGLSDYQALAGGERARGATAVVLASVGAALLGLAITRAIGVW